MRFREGKTLNLPLRLKPFQFAAAEFACAGSSAPYSPHCAQTAARSGSSLARTEPNFYSPHLSLLIRLHSRSLAILFLLRRGGPVRLRTRTRCPAQQFSRPRRTANKRTCASSVPEWNSISAQKQAQLLAAAGAQKYRCPNLCINYTCFMLPPPPNGNSYRGKMMIIIVMTGTNWPTWLREANLRANCPFFPFHCHSGRRTNRISLFQPLRMLVSGQQIRIKSSAFASWQTNKQTNREAEPLETKCETFG